MSTPRIIIVRTCAECPYCLWSRKGFGPERWPFYCARLDKQEGQMKELDGGFSPKLEVSKACPLEPLPWKENRQ